MNCVYRDLNIGVNDSVPSATFKLFINRFGSKIKKIPAVSARIFVVWEGIEPPTQGFSVLCSTN